MATVKVREANLESKMERVDQMTTTYFEVDTKVWGMESSDFSVIPWETLEAGEHKFPFALKFCNVNFPPSVDDPPGFTIRYTWSAHLDGPGFHPGLRSPQYCMPYRPIICAQLRQPWVFNELLCKSDSKATPLARLKAVVPQQAFCPDELFLMNIAIECLPSDMIVKDVAYTFKKHFDGKLRLQQGTVFRSTSRTILRDTLGVPGNDGSVELGVRFSLPTRQVSPSFASQHIRVYYSLLLDIALESAGRLLKKPTTHRIEASIPIAIANLPYEQLPLIANLTSIQSYRVSKEAPLFFDPSLDEPPATPLPGVPQDTPLQSPPNYFSLPTLPPQLQRTQRVEKTVFTSRSIRPGQVPELGEPAEVVDVFDDEW
ncbi:hypothetical protein BX666DRAFT_2019879 [Dichotomocladium elegans]|nr:hypothetical protein BX666DRAFT_2019879 [Dichotomocladium elegans]